MLQSDNFSVMREVFEEKRDYQEDASLTDFKLPGVVSFKVLNFINEKNLE